MYYCTSIQKSSRDVQRGYCSKSLMGALPVVYSHMDVIMHHNYDLLLYFTPQTAAILLLKPSPTKQLYPNPSFTDFTETLGEQSEPFQTSLLSCELSKAELIY